MLADFAVRLAAGLAVLLLATPVKEVPPRFYRTHALVILSLLVLAALVYWSAGTPATTADEASRTAAAGAVGVPAHGLILAGSAAVLAYLATVCWGMGLPRLAGPLTAAVAGVGGWILVAISVAEASATGVGPVVIALNALARTTSAVLLGASLSAMLLGHYYLTASTMSIEPLKRYIAWSGWGLAARGAVAAAGVAVAATHAFGTAGLGGSPVVFEVIRWGMGVVAAGVALRLAWQTALIRSTQSATGILYIATILVLFGELAALAAQGSTGVAM